MHGLRIYLNDQQGDTTGVCSVSQYDWEAFWPFTMAASHACWYTRG
jgi:hypothetical protein